MHHNVRVPRGWLFALSLLTLAATCPPQPPPTITTTNVPFDNFRLDVPAAPIDNYDRTFPIFAGPQATDFSLRISITNLGRDNRVEMQKGDGTVLQTFTTDGTFVTSLFGGNVANIRVRLPGAVVTSPDVVIKSMTTLRTSARQFPAISGSGANLVTAFPVTPNVPVDFAVLPNVPDDFFFSVSGLGSAPFDVIVVGSESVWFDDPNLGAFALSPTEAMSPPFTPVRTAPPALALPNFALFRVATGVNTLRITITSQGIARPTGVVDPFHVRLIAAPAGAPQMLAFPSVAIPAFAIASPIGVDDRGTPSRGTSGLPSDKLDCVNWAGHSPGVLTPAVAGAPTTLVPVPGGLVCYNGHSGSDFLLVDPGLMAAGVPVNAAASGFVVQTAAGNIDVCHADPLAPAGVSCPGTTALNANFVVVRQDDGRFARYYHLRNDTLPVKPGDRVGCGQFLGHVGSSGISATPHLHFELNTMTQVQVPLVLSDPDGTIGSFITAGTRNVIIDPYAAGGIWRQPGGGGGVIPLPCF
jgi:hypothetical protein